MSTHETEMASARAKALRRGVEFLRGSHSLDALAAEVLLVALADKLGRPVHAVAEDVARGEPFPGRPAWM